MSLRKLFFPGRRDRATESGPSAPPSGASSGAGPDSGVDGVPSSRRQERQARRAHLQALVRDSLLRAGVLSAGYRCKVLSLDSRGQSFIAMVDLLAGSRPTLPLTTVEQEIALAAARVHGIELAGVYWRAEDGPGSLPGLDDRPR